MPCVLPTDTPSSSDPSGSLGSRLNELKQKVVAENPQEYGVAVPRKCLYFILLHIVSPLTSIKKTSVMDCSLLMG